MTRNTFRKRDAARRKKRARAIAKKIRGHRAAIRGRERCKKIAT